MPSIRHTITGNNEREGKTMIFTVFRKKVTPKNGNKPFNKYVTTLTDKDGEKTYCDVMFDETISKPSEFPCVVEVEKKNANLSTKTRDYTDEKTGETKTYTRNTLWIKAIKNVSEYVDTSLDNFD